MEQVRSLPSDDFPFPGVLRTNVGTAWRMVMPAIRQADELINCKRTALKAAPLCLPYDFDKLALVFQMRTMKSGLPFASAQNTKKGVLMDQQGTESRRTIPVPASKTYRVEEIAAILGIGRSSAYNLVRKGNFKVLRIGTSIRVSKSSFDDWLDHQEE